MSHLAKLVAISYSQPNESMVLHHSCSAPKPWSGSTGEVISSRAEVCVYLHGEPLSRIKLAGKQYQGALLYLEDPSRLFTATADYIVHFIAVDTTATFRFSLLSHSFTSVCTLPHSRSPTHTLRTLCTHT